MIKERLGKLREVMKQEGVQCLVIPTSDYHNSEYVSEYFMARKYFSGFTGSAGTLVVAEDQAALFTDGRYFIQAARELPCSDITLMKMGEPGVPAVKDYIKEILKKGQKLGFDGRVVTAGEGEAYEKLAEAAEGRVVYDRDFCGMAWEGRPQLAFTPVYQLSEAYSGESCEGKLARLREKMKEKGAEIHYLTTLDDIAWLFNLRADDVESCPVLLSYAAITETESYLFAGEKAFSEEIREYLAKNHIILRPYDSFYDFVAARGMENKEEKILVCKNRINYRLLKELPRERLIDSPNPTTRMKAVKNETEQENLRKAHLMDGIAVTRFMYWLKKNVGKIPMDEISVAEHLKSLRAQNPSFIEPSFETISAYGDNGAIIHYSAKKDACSTIQAKGMLMVDSGGHYYEGTTDITRTFILGEITEEMRQHFTLVARAVMRLKSLRFLKGCRGTNLDLAAREVFWQQGLDYKHGTGHGVGYLLNVHEGPNSFRYKELPGSDNDWEFEEGMVTTDEPGIYIEGSHGIRTENELLCRKGEQNGYGQFMHFEDLTYVPIDLDGIDPAAMEESEKKTLNAYHKSVYEKLSPYFEGEELEFLKKATREI